MLISLSADGKFKNFEKSFAYTFFEILMKYIRDFLTIFDILATFGAFEAHFGHL